ncbi:hypothetical protein [Hydrogeniiclostridium mannosilyticum]|nr:hypothetical protein [Hydrogeniiclostridium mannosilyticum]
MLVYCNNNPVMLVDSSGTYSNTIYDIINRQIETANSIIQSSNRILQTTSRNYRSLEEATTDWANKYRTKSKEREYGAILYKSKNAKTNTVSYSYGITYKGFENNTIPGFIVGYITGRFKVTLDPNIEMVGFIHTHPQSEKGYHNDYPSDPDLFLLNLPGINEVYVVPYSRCSGTSAVIEGSISITWDYENHIAK